MNNKELVSKIKDSIDESGIRYTVVAEKANIPYQRLNRILNQGAILSASEFLDLINLLDLDIGTVDKAQ